MIYKRFGDKLVIRLNRGDELVESIRDIMQKENIKAASITGLGAVGMLSMGIYNEEKKTYDNLEFNEMLEVTNLTGNISQMDGEIYHHLHITVGDHEGMAHAGHLNKAVISMTAEIFVDIIDGYIGRVYDDETGLNLIEF